MRYFVVLALIFSSEWLFSQCALITNGDFEVYGTPPPGFTSPDQAFQPGYPTACPNWDQYAVGKSICNTNGNWGGYPGDHTTGTGNALFIDITPYAALPKIYSVDIVTTPGEQYRFSYWGKSIFSVLNGADPSIDLMVDNVSQNSLNVFTYFGGWQYKEYIFTTTNPLTNLMLYHTFQHSGSGYDFVMDDACAEPVLDSVRVRYLNPYTDLCTGDTARFQFEYFGFNGGICFNVDTGGTSFDSVFQNNQIYKLPMNTSKTITFKATFCGGRGYNKSYTISVAPNLPASIVSTDICDGGVNTVAINGVPGGIFSLVAPVLGSATVNAATGEIANYQSPGAYILKYDVGVPSCFGFGFDTIQVLDVDVASISMTDFCGTTSAPAQVTGATGGTFSFSPLPTDGANIIASTGLISNASPGAQYNVSYVTTGICPTTASTSVSVIPNSNPTFVFSDFCPGSIVLPVIMGDPNGTFSFSPQPSDGATIDPVTGQITSNSDNVTYSVKYTVGFCQDSSVLSVYVYQKPRAIMFGSGDLCDLAPDSLQISFIGTAPFDFTFSEGANIYNYLNYSGLQYSQLVDQPRNYSMVNVADANCTGEVTGEATFVSQDILFSVNETAGCPGVDINFEILSPIISTATCTWDFGDGNTYAGCTGVHNIYSVEDCHDVELTILASSGCTGQTTTQDLVCVYPLPVPDFNSTPEVPTFFNSTLEFYNASAETARIQWIMNGVYQGEENTMKYEFPIDTNLVNELCLIAESDQGCLDTLCKMIKLEEEFVLYVPNTFTPNDDELNDVFLPIVKQAVEYDFRVIDRWGSAIYQTHDMNGFWDGTKDGVKSPQGLYLWHIELKNNKGKSIVKNGQVLMVY